MIDAFAIFLSHTLLAIAWWRLRSRDDLDDEAPPQAHHRSAGFGWRGGEG
ncbi:MAG: hypothetical protein MUF41_01295 [Sphingopyxis sp.]|jgi:hypothetical protein|nr:hypothetical protein [Sphingopyxis sp.]